MSAAWPDGSPAVLPASVIIATRNRPELVIAAVRAVLAGDSLPAEIVVVDQSDQPNDRIASVAVDPVAIRYLWEPTRGLSKGRNAGIRAAGHDTLVFIDDDVLPAPPWLRILFQALVDAGPKAIVAGAAIHGTPEGSGTFATALIAARTRRTFHGRSAEPAVGFINMATHRSAFGDVGLFDERLGAGSHFPAAEDNDLVFRLLDAGYTIEYNPDAVVVHRAWRPAGTYDSMRWNYGYGQGAFYAKHMKLHDAYTLRLLIREARRRLLRARQRWKTDKRLARGDLAYLLGLLVGAADWLVAVRAREALKRLSRGSHEAP